jgi:hypothetical protein
MSGGCRVVIVAVLLLLLILKPPLDANASSIQAWESDGWRFIKTSDLTVMFTANGSRPVFVWWRNDDSNTRYLVDFIGLLEYFTATSTPTSFRGVYVANNTGINTVLVKPVIDKLTGLNTCIEDAVKIIDRYGEIGVNIEDFRNSAIAVMFKVDNTVQYVESFNKSLTILRDSIRALKIKYRSFDPYIYVKQLTINELHLNLDELLTVLSSMAELNVTAMHVRDIDYRIDKLNGLMNDLKTQFGDLSKYVDSLIANEYCSSCRNVMSNTRNDCLARLSGLVDSFNDLNVSIRGFNAYVKTLINVDREGLEREVLVLSSLLSSISPAMDYLDSSCRSMLGIVKRCVDSGVESYYKCRFPLAKNLIELKSKLAVLSRDINNTVSKVLENVNQAVESTHPPFLSFQKCEWYLTDLEYIPLGSSEAIGVAFTYMLKSAPSRFNFTEGNIMVRCRLYTSPVVEEVNGVEYSVSKAELRIDVVIQGWIWITPIVVDRISQVLDGRINTSTNIFNALALWINLASVNMTYVGDLWRGQYGGNLSASNTILLDNLLVNINVESRDEVEVKLNKSPVKFSFMSGGDVLKGFLKLMSEAFIQHFNNTSSTSSIYLSYLEAPGFLKLYICYPYFNGGVLEHNPSLGVDVKEGGPIARVSIPIASRFKPYITPIEVKPLNQPLSSTISIPPETSSQTPTVEVIIIVALVAFIAVVIILLGRGKTFTHPTQDKQDHSR